MRVFVPLLPTVTASSSDALKRQLKTHRDLSVVPQLKAEIRRLQRFLYKTSRLLRLPLPLMETGSQVESLLRLKAAIPKLFVDFPRCFCRHTLQVVRVYMADYNDIRQSRGDIIVFIQIIAHRLFI